MGDVPVNDVKKLNKGPPKKKAKISKDLDKIKTPTKMKTPKKTLNTPTRKSSEIEHQKRWNQQKRMLHLKTNQSDLPQRSLQKETNRRRKTKSYGGKNKAYGRNKKREGTKGIGKEKEIRRKKKKRRRKITTSKEKGS